jgi:hypothetical protein
VLQKVRHTGLTVAFVPRTDQIDYIYGDFGFGVVGKKQNVEAVRKSILRDSLNGGYLLNAPRQRLRQSRNGRDDGGYRNSNMSS